MRLFAYQGCGRDINSNSPSSIGPLIALHLATGSVVYLLITFLICDTKPGRIFTALCICVWPIVLTLLAVLLVEELLAYIGAQLWARMKDKLN